MTAQTPDTIVYRGHHYDLAGVNGRGLFDPADYGLELDAFDSSCWRGYVARYAVRSGLLIIAKLELGLTDTSVMPDPLYGARPIHSHACYRDGREAVPFTGGLLAADGFLEELYVHMGFHPAWKYRTVHELIFEDGRLVDAHDRSAAMARVREAFDDPALGDPNDRTMIAQIEACFDRSYAVIADDEEDARSDLGAIIMTLLEMVAVLHRRGFERLRIAPAMAPSGMSWRCSVTHRGNMPVNHGAIMDSYDELVVHYTSAAEREYFDWDDAGNDTSEELADRFEERFPEIMREARGDDREYVVWYQEMLSLAKTGEYPVAYDDDYDPYDPDWLPTTRDRRGRLRMPPGGDAPRSDFFDS